jgi:arsenite-transporting ATPase
MSHPIENRYQWYAGRISQWDEKAWKIAQSFGLVPTQKTLDLLDRIEAEMTSLRQVLIDPAISSYRVVFNPEKIVIKETQRAVTYLNLFGYSVDAGIINRVLPTEPSPDPYWCRLQEIQQHYLKLSQDTLMPLTLFEVPWYSHEVVGQSALESLAQNLWKELDPTSIFWQGPTQTIEERNDEYVLCLPLPHVEMDKVNITKRGDELFIAIGNFKRELSLPSVLAIRQATRARLSNAGILEVHFTKTG